MHVFVEKLLYFYSYCDKIWFEVSNCQKTSIGLNDGWALNRQNAIIWTNGGLFNWRAHALLDLNGLNRGPIINS